MERRIMIILSGIVTALVAASGVAMAESQPASKATAQVGSINILDEKDLDWQTILSNTMKTSSQKDLFVNVALECGLMTKTLVKSKGGTSDTSSTQASVDVRVLVDNVPALPGEVAFCRRSQELTATFQGLIDGCLAVDPLTGSVILDETCVKPEELELIQDTMDANAFHFVLDDVGVGAHTIKVQAKIDSGVSAQSGLADAAATIGKGSMTVEEVRLIKNEEIALP